MAKTEEGKKLVYVAPHKREGKPVDPHYRTPPCPAPKQPKKK